MGLERSKRTEDTGDATHKPSGRRSVCGSDKMKSFYQLHRKGRFWKSSAPAPRGSRKDLLKHKKELRERDFARGPGVQTLRFHAGPRI